MAATTRTCPKCGGPLNPTAGDAAKLSCKPCGLSFGVRPKKAAVAAAAAASRPRASAFADLTDAPQTPREVSPASGANSRPAGDPRLRLALLVGAGLAVVFLALIGAVVFVVVLAARTAQPTPVAVAPVNLPASPTVSDPMSDPAPPSPHKDIPAPAPPPKKSPPPIDEPPPVAPIPPAAPPAADPAPPELKPAPEPKPMPDPMPAPEVKPAAGPIDRAIDKAVVYLKKEAMGGGGGPPGLGAMPGGFGMLAGSGVGVMGLTGLALMESGVPTDDPAVMAAVKAVRDGAPTCGNTYEMAIAVWCLDRLGDPKDEDLIRDLAARLIAGQLDHGKWTYFCPQVGAGGGPAPVPGFNRPVAPLGLGFGMPGMELSADQIKDLMETLTKYEPSAAIPAKKQLAPVCRFVRGKRVEADRAGAFGAFGFGGGDLSLTQFAVLGLWVARKHRVPVDRSLLLAEAFVRANQEADGGWSYSGRGMGTTDSMTCSGMMELAIGRGVGHSEGAKTAGADPQFEKGLVYLADLFTRGVPPKQKDVKADPKEVQNLAAVSNRLQAQFGPLMMHGLMNQHALWLKELTAFQADVDRALALDLPADAKKDLQGIADQIKAYKDSPAEKKKKEKEGLDQLLQQSTVLQPFGGMKGFGFGGGMGRLLRPGKFNRMNMDDIYCLWSLERLCMVCDLKTAAGRDWYAWGAELLVNSQNDDGSWTNAGICGTQVDTCLAVLFLKRVNVAKDLTAQLKLIAPIRALPPDKLKYIAPGTSPSPGETLIKSAGETPKETPKP